MSTLSELLPGTIADAPKVSPPFNASAFRSRRKADSCFFAPWHEWQLLAKIGSMSLVNSILRVAAGGSLVESASAALAIPVSGPWMPKTKIANAAVNQLTDVLRERNFITAFTGVTHHALRLFPTSTASEAFKELRNVRSRRLVSVVHKRPSASPVRNGCNHPVLRSAELLSLYTIRKPCLWPRRIPSHP